MKIIYTVQSFIFVPNTNGYSSSNLYISQSVQTYYGPPKIAQNTKISNKSEATPLQICGSVQHLVYVNKDQKEANYKIPRTNICLLLPSTNPLPCPWDNIAKLACNCPCKSIQSPLSTNISICKEHSNCVCVCVCVCAHILGAELVETK